MVRSIEELDAELERIVGGNSDEGSAKKPESFKTAFDKLSKDNQEILDEFGGRAKKAAKAERDIKKQTAVETAENKGTSHSEIIKVHREATLQEKLNIDYALIKNAFESKGNAKKTESGSVELILDGLTEMNPKEYVYRGKYRDKITLNEPAIFYKPISEEKGWSKKRTATNQVEVVVIMNNSTNLAENTVVTMVVQHKGGKLIWGNGQPGLYGVNSMSEFVDDVEASFSKKATSNQKLAGGDITIQEYNRLYQKENGESLTEMWHEWDKKVGETPDDKDPHAGEKIKEKGATDDEREKIIAKLGNRYTEKLQNLQNLQKEILERVNIKLVEIRTRNEDIIKDALFTELKRLVDDNPDFHKQTIAAIKTSLVKFHGIEISYLDNLIEKGA